MNDFLSKAPRPVSIASPADRELRSRRRSSTSQLLHYPQSSPQHKGAYFPKTLHGDYYAPVSVQGGGALKFTLPPMA